MPRWAEMIGIVTVGLLLTGSIMVYAKWTNQRARERASVPADSPDVAAVAAVALPSDKPRTPSASEVDAAARRAMRHVALKAAASRRSARAAEPAPVMAPVPAETGEPTLPLPSLGPGLDPNVPPPQPVRSVQDELADLVDVHAAITEDTEGVVMAIVDGSPVPPPVVAEAKRLDAAALSRVKRGSKAELALLQKAEQALEDLYSMRLTRSRTPAVAEERRKELAAVMNQLPPATRQELQTWLDSGYNTARRPPGAGSPYQDGAAGVAPGQRAVGTDDTPADVLRLRSRIGTLTRTHGPVAAPARSARAPVNPAKIPSAAPPARLTSLPAKSPGQGSVQRGIPSAGAQ